MLQPPPRIGARARTTSWELPSLSLLSAAARVGIWALSSCHQASQLINRPQQTEGSEEMVSARSSSSSTGQQQNGRKRQQQRHQTKRRSGRGEVRCNEEWFSPCAREDAVKPQAQNSFSAVGALKHWCTAKRGLNRQHGRRPGVTGCVPARPHGVPPRSPSTSCWHWQPLWEGGPAGTPNVVPPAAGRRLSPAG